VPIRLRRIDRHTLEARTSAERKRLDDIIVLASSAMTAFTTGRILESGGWANFDMLVLPLVGTVMLSLFSLVQ